MSELPKVPSKWKHYKGNEYEVYDLLNTDADPGREVDHPVIVCYRGANGRKWGKTLEVFLSTMKPVEKSAWQARKERINGLAAQPSDTTNEVVIPVGRPTLVPRELLGGAFIGSDTVEYMIPEIKLWSPSKPGGIGAFAFVQLAPDCSDTVTNENKLQFIRDLWEASMERNSLGLNYMQDAVTTVANQWSDKLRLGNAAQIARERILESNTSLIGLRQNQPYATTFCTSFGGDLMELTVFLSILRHISLKFRGELYTECQLHMICEDFNRLVHVATASRMFHPRNVPAAVIENYRLRFLLPRDIKGDMNSEPQYAETEFVDGTLRILFDPEVTALIVNIFGGDCLTRILI